jgi:TRAP-type C4-dicarboxylate transport system permease small subunit
MGRAFTVWYARLLSWLLAFSVAVLIIPVSLQIFSRYTQLIPAYIWTEEMARFLFIWMVMIGAMVGVREGSHFEVDVWPDLGAKATAALQLAAGAFILLFAFVFLWAGWEFTRFAWNRVSELADLPLWMIHVAWPITGLTWFVFQASACGTRALVLAGRAQPKAEAKHLEAV